MLPSYIPYTDIDLLKVHEFSEVQEAFNIISYDWGIEYNFPHGGCQQRAQIISLLLKRKLKIDHLKIWLFAPAAMYQNNSAMLQLIDKNYLSPSTHIEWSFHVAPVVRVNDSGILKTVVMDPSVNRDTPLEVNDWFAALGNSQIGQYSFLMPEKYFFNSSYHTDEQNMISMLFDGSFYDYVNPAKDNLAVEKGLAINDLVKIIYEKYIVQLIQNPKPEDFNRLEDLKSIFGNATAMDMLFSQNISGYTDNTTMRYVITNYGNIIREAKEIFNNRVFYWTEIVNMLL